MMEEDNVDAYLQRVEEVISTLRGLGETMEETMVVQKLLRSLLAKFNPKVSTVEDRNNPYQIRLDEFHSILTAYEMII